MAPASPSPSDASHGSKKNKSKAAAKSKKDDEEEVPDSEPEGGDDDEGEEGDHKKGMVNRGKMAFYVKWKGYDEDENSWINEEDANAPELIEEYWEKQKKPKPSPTKRSARKSSAASDDDSEVVESVSAPKKRGRKSNAAKEAEAEEEDEDRPTKKARRNTKKNDEPEQLPTEEELGNMDQYRDAPSWDHLVKHVDTVERSEKNDRVYFTLHSGERIREDSAICADKFPKLLIKFYETNLRWRESDNNNNSS
ncbi:Chromo domain-containing protein [Mycena chlorophos]|uniref:Chromo domain-containing protein n=1 Tax=Mycena chlorophos TaxID=658473 RepID=A0A8H6RYA5_MYCCL|nr:Chromo domain-containing protein [Mycena chlorophos]